MLPHAPPASTISGVFLIVQRSRTITHGPINIAKNLKLRIIVRSHSTKLVVISVRVLLHVHIDGVIVSVLLLITVRCFSIRAFRHVRR